MFNKKALLFGLGLTSALFLRLSVVQAKKEKQLSPIYRGNKPAKLKRVDLEKLANRKDVSIPSLVIKLDEDKRVPGTERQKGMYETFVLNFTPRRASETHDESKSRDLQYVQKPNEIPNEFKKLKAIEKRKTIHPNDFAILKSIGVIPSNFPLNQIAYTTSPNLKNEFLIGYSNEYTFDPKTRKSLEVIKPLFIVSFGKAFDTNTSLNPSVNKELDLRDAGARMLYAEGLLHKTAESGCSTLYGFNECQLERMALLNVLLNRKARRHKRYNENYKYHNVITDKKKGKFSHWNSDSSFMGKYNGHLEVDSNWKKRVPLPNKYKKRFNRFYDSMFWNMPKIALEGSHFVHYMGMSNEPSRSMPTFITNPEFMDDFGYTNTYVSPKPIKVGQTLVTDSRERYL